MKIYPSVHEVKATDVVQLRDIPLSYIDVDASQMDVKIVRQPEFCAPTKTPVNAYEEFSSPDVYLFDDYNQRVTDNLLQRVGNNYAYVPRNATEFTPLWFAFTAIVKRSMKFYNDKSYNLRVACTGKDLTFAQNLITIFGDAPQRGICPSNISINNQAVTVDSLINSAFKDNDIVFIESPDGVNFVYTSTDSNGKAVQVSEALDFDTMMNEHTNVWLSVESFGSVIEVLADDVSYSLSGPRLYSNNKYMISDYKYHFNTDTEHASFPKATYNYVNIFDGDCPILLLEKPKGGYIVVTQKNFFNDLSNNASLLYEVLMNVFFNTYYETASFSSWITDQPVDFIAFQSNRFDMNHMVANLDTLLSNPNYEIGQEFSLVSIKTDNANVVFSNINSNNDLFFTKVNIQPDPVKKDGYVSIYTTQHSVILFKAEVINKLETGLSINSYVSDTGIYIRVAPCKSTKYQIDSGSTQSLSFPNLHDKFILCCLNSSFSLIREANYDPQQHGLKMATVQAFNHVVPKNYDIRILGGGLTEDSDPDYDMLDIGHALGRPYRVGSVLMVNLPKRLQQYNDKIQDAINQHAQSGDYAVIIYK